MPIDDKLLLIRGIARSRGKDVMNKLFDDHLTGLIKEKNIPSCFLCGNTDNITREHILPKWVFQGNTKRSFIIDVNQLEVPYIKATLPCCKTCNNDTLNSLEKEIQKILLKDIRQDWYSYDEWSSIIRWLEIIDFKFQVFDISTKFRSHKKNYVPYLAETSIAFMRDFSVRTITSKARLSLKRIARKDKWKNGNSLVGGITKNTSFYYFHKSGEFLYLEIPNFNKFFFLFLNKYFENTEVAVEEAMKIINKVYSIPNDETIE